MRFKKSSLASLITVSSLALTALTGCNGSDDSQSKVTLDKAVTENAVTESAVTDNYFLAINVGGERYTASDGSQYFSDTFTIANNKATTNGIKGSQDPTLYETFRQGEMALSQQIPNGTYDVIFKFAEPSNTPVGERIFNVYAEQQLVIPDLDVRGARDGKDVSALDRAVSDIEVNDGILDIRLESIKGEPILSAIVIQQKTKYDDNWQLVWKDEFNYEGAPDPTKWTHDIWPAKTVNSEDQVYTDRLKNVSVNGEHLIIKAFKEDYDNGHYTSGRIHSEGKGDFLYGRFDIRAKLPAGQGTWPAIWMLPSDPYRYSTTCKPGEKWQGSSTCDAWPNSGEIDIMEHVGYDMQNVHGTVHNKAYYWVNWEQRKGSIEGVDVDQNFHVYSLIWTPEKITILMDGTPYFTYINEHTGWQAWPFDHPFNVILNVAIGGAWGGAGGPIDDSVFPVQMEVDYVRVYKRAGL